jgi:hypothetical protein
MRLAAFAGRAVYCWRDGVFVAVQHGGRLWAAPLDEEVFLRVAGINRMEVWGKEEMEGDDVCSVIPFAPIFSCVTVARKFLGVRGTWVQTPTGLKRAMRRQGWRTVHGRESWGVSGVQPAEGADIQRAGWGAADSGGQAADRG